MYAWLSTVIIYVLKNELSMHYIGEPKLDVKNIYVKEILSHLLANAEARSLYSRDV